MCPVANPQIVRFSTGPVSVRAVGINVPMKMNFARDTTCSPLTVNGTFVHPKILDRSLVYYYYYEATRHFPLTSITTDPMQERERSSMYRVT